jgi:hypothetical protein
MDWKFDSSVKRDTKLLIVANEHGMSNKSIAAMKYKTAILNLDGDFDINMVNLDNY